MTKRRRNKSKLQLAHNSWPTHAHHLLCKRISADMQAHNSCCAAEDTNYPRNLYYLFQQHFSNIPTRRECVMNL